MKAVCIYKIEISNDGHVLFSVYTIRCAGHCHAVCSCCLCNAPYLVHNTDKHLACLQLLYSLRTNHNHGTGQEVRLKIPNAH